MNIFLFYTGSGLEHIPCIGKWILCHCITKEVPMAALPRHAHGDLTSLAPHERLPEILVVPREKTPTRELRAFFSCMAWRAIPGPLSKRKRRLDSLEAAQGRRCYDYPHLTEAAAEQRGQVRG